MRESSRVGRKKYRVPGFNPACSVYFINDTDVTKSWQRLGQGQRSYYPNDKKSVFEGIFENPTGLLYACVFIFSPVRVLPLYPVTNNLFC